MKKEKINIIKEKLEQLATSVSDNANTPKKPIKVIFDKSSNSPWEVVFSERGFLIENTRLSFEEIKNALSKEYTITLNSGRGLVLDGVKMQSIMKYNELI